MTRDDRGATALLRYASGGGVRPMRQIERACRVDVAFQVICARLRPDHTTVARCYQRYDETSKMSDRQNVWGSPRR